MIKREHEKETWDILTGVVLQTFTVVINNMGEIYSNYTAAPTVYTN